MSYEKMLRGSVTASKSPHTNKVEAVKAERATESNPHLRSLALGNSLGAVKTDVKGCNTVDLLKCVNPQISVSSKQRVIQPC
jgi:hypothetical protein